MAELLGTLITGCPRSGTTLALKLMCPDITPEEVDPLSTHNEPAIIAQLRYQWATVGGDMHEAVNASMPQCVAASRHRVVKAPHIMPMLPLLDRRYRVIITFRDARLIIASMLSHSSSRCYAELNSKALAIILGKPLSSAAGLSYFDSFKLLVDSYYRFGVTYAPELTEVWNYGFWDEWQHDNENIQHLYDRTHESSERVLADVAGGATCSSKSFTLDVWRETCERFEITRQMDKSVREINDRMKHLYGLYGYTLKTLDDLGA